VKKIRTHYENLQVARNASPEVIKGAYKFLCQKYHPDKYEGDLSEANRILRIINIAYSVLSDPETRAVHDEWIRKQEAEAVTNKATSDARMTSNEHSEVPSPLSLNSSTIPKNKKSASPSKSEAIEGANRSWHDRLRLTLRYALALVAGVFLVSSLLLDNNTTKSMVILCICLAGMYHGYLIYEPVAKDLRKFKERHPGIFFLAMPWLDLVTYFVLAVIVKEWHTAQDLHREKILLGSVWLVFGIAPIIAVILARNVLSWLFGSATPKNWIKKPIIFLLVVGLWWMKVMHDEDSKRMQRQADLNASSTIIQP
jgi:hypothetical protein